MKPKQNLRKLAAVGCIAASVSVTLGLLSLTNLSYSWQTSLSTNLYYEHPASEDIVVIYIDESSLAEEALGKWEHWSRKYYAQAIDNLKEAGTAIIGVDILFNRESQGVSKDGLEEAFTTNPTTNGVLEDLHKYLEEDHPADITLGESIDNAGNVVLAKYPGANGSDIKSIDVIANGALAEGYVYSNITQSESLLSLLLEDGFDINIAELFTGKSKDNIPTKDNELYINYTGPAGTYKAFSFYDIYTGNFDKKDFEGKIALIGVGTVSLQDHYSIPLGENTMYGVEIHANAIQTILDEAYLRDVTTGEKFAILATLSLLATVIFMYLGIGWTIGALTVLAIGYWISAEAAFRKGLILDLVYPYIALITTYLASMLYRYFTEIQSGKELKSAFGHYVSPEVVKQISQNPDSLKLGGDKRSLTIFFADIQDFTTWSEGAEPQALVAQLNEYFSALSKVIMDNQGTVDKFEGDAIMAFWGAPLAVENHAELTCKTALEARLRLTELNKKWASEGKREITFRIGINTGEAIVGNIGSQERFDYTAIGDNVNLAARLESANKFYGTHIMISEHTHALLKDKFATRRLDRIRVKGKDKPIDIFELIATKNGLADGADQFINEFHSAIEYYRNGKFQEAKERFQEIAKKAPQDGPTKTYLERIEKLIDNPPENWDGTWTFTNK